MTLRERMGVEAQGARCVNHRRAATQLRCGRCDDSICHRCVVHAPGGMRCPACSRHEGGRPARGNRALLITFGVIVGGVTSFYAAMGLNDLFAGASGEPTPVASAAIPVAPQRPAGTPTAQPIAPPVPVPAQLVRGTAVVVDGWGEVTLHTLEIGARSAGDLAPPVSASLTIADVEACVADLAVRLQPDAFYLQMTDHTRIAPRIEPTGKAPALGEATLLVGDCVRGYLTFEIPEGREIRSLNLEMTDPLTGEIRRVWWTPQH